jgi:hypothetical protein
MNRWRRRAGDPAVLIGQLDDEFDRSLNRRLAQVWGFGAVAPAVAALAWNFQLLAKVESQLILNAVTTLLGRDHSAQDAFATLRDGWSNEWRIDPGQSMMAVLGIGAIVATISVAVMAALWRPQYRDLESDYPVSRTISLLTRASLTISSMAVSFALLSAGTANVVWVMLLFVTFAISLISAGTKERADKNSDVVREHHAAQHVDACRKRLIFFCAAHPWSSNIQRESAVKTVLYYLAAPLLSATVVLLTIAIGAIRYGASISDILDTYRNWILLVAAASIPVWIATVLLGISIAARYDGSGLATARLWFGMSAMLWAIPAAAAIGIPAQGGVGGKLVWAEAVLFPPLSQLVLALRGRRGRWPGARPYVRVGRALRDSLARAERELKIAQARATSAKKPTWRSRWASR